MDRVEFVAEQLRKISPGVDWNVAGIERSNELAQILVRSGVTDLWALKLIPVQWREWVDIGWSGGDAGEEIPAHYEDRSGYAFDYYGNRFGYLGEWDRQTNDPAFKTSEFGPLLAWSAKGHGNVSYVLSKNAQTGRLQIRPIWASSSDAGTVRTVAKLVIGTLVFTALPLAGVNVGAMIGNAVLPASIASAYPALASAVGNVALSAAMNGGDVKTAVRGVVSSQIGAGVGGFAEMAGSGELIGALAESATTAALRGDDIKSAVFQSALTTGLPMFGMFDVDYSGPAFGDDVIGGSQYDFGFEVPNMGEIDPSLAEFPATFNPLPDDALFTANPGTAFDDSVFDPVGFDAFDTGLIQSFQPTQTGVPTTPPIVPPSNDNSFTPQNLIQGVTAAALSVIKVIDAYRRLDRPQINTQARNVGPGGQVSVIGNNGLIQTRTADGRVIAQKPPIGIPQATVSGDYIVNNGDGTYTVVNPAGQSRTLAYAPTVAQSAGIPWGLVAAGVGIFLLARRK